MPTRFTSLGIAGTATIATLVATAVTLTTVSITTLTATSATVTRLNATTATGGTLEIRPSAGSGVLTIKSAGGTNSGGLICISGADGALNVCAISGGILDCNNFSAKSGLCS